MNHTTFQIKFAGERDVEVRPQGSVAIPSAHRFDDLGIDAFAADHVGGEVGAEIVRRQVLEVGVTISGSGVGSDLFDKLPHPFVTDRDDLLAVVYVLALAVI